MTRREELGERALQIVKQFVKQSTHGIYPLRYEIEKALLHVERECWQRAEEKIEQLMENENESTDDQIWEYRDWCRAQKEQLG